MGRALKDFDGYRKEFFVNPRRPIDPRFIQAGTFLMSRLLGMPSGQLPQDNTPLNSFVHELAAKMEGEAGNDSMPGSRHFDEKSMAQLHPNGNMPAILANVSSVLRNNNTIFAGVSPAETQMEQEAVTWLAKEIAGYDPSESSGVITVGGTLANLTALTAARERLSSKRTNRGKRAWNGDKAYVLASEAAHYSIDKAAAILSPNGGIEVLKIPLEKDGFRMDSEQLERYVKKLRKAGKPIMAIVGVAGETETGLVDDLNRMADIAAANGIFFHVDGAYGAPFRLTRQSELFRGMERGDSLTIDPHKYMYAPYPAGSVLFKDRTDHDRLEVMNDRGSGYVFQDDQAKQVAQQGQPEFIGKRRIEGSMGGQGASGTWAVIHALGKEGLGLVLEHTLDVTQHAYATLAESDVFSPVFRPDLNSLCFYPDPTLSGNSDVAKLLTYQGYTATQDTHKNPKQEVLQNMLIEEARQRLEDRTGVYMTTTELSVPVEGKGFSKTDMSAEVEHQQKKKTKEAKKPRVVRRLQKDNPTEERKYLKVFRIVPTHPYTDVEQVDFALSQLHSIWGELLTQVATDTLPEQNSALKQFVTQAKEATDAEKHQQIQRRRFQWMRNLYQ